MKSIRNTTTHTRSFLRTVGIFLCLPMLVLALIPTAAHAKSAYDCDESYYSSNDVLFFNPCSTNNCSAANAGGALTSAGPSSLAGSTNEEKVWNYFIARGLTPVAAAGAMGNIQQESNFSASVEEHSGGGGMGLIQWTGGRRTSLENAAATAGVNLADNDQALLFELDYLWDGEYGALTWQEPVNAEETVDGDTSKASYNGDYASQRAETQTGNGSTMVFHAMVERSGDTPTMLEKRISNAQAFLDKYDGSAARGTCDYVGAGGLDFEQAVALAKKIADNWDGIYCGSGSIKGGFYCGWESGYCTAGAAWMAVTTAPDPGRVPGIPNGVDVADRLISMNPEVYTAVNPDGSNLQPFSVWSFGDGSVSGQPGHTGTVVGVGEDGKIITFETNWSGGSPGSNAQFLYNPGHKVAVFEYSSFEAFKAGHSGYVFNNMATPKDASVATEMGKKIAEFMGN